MYLNTIYTKMHDISGVQITDIQVANVCMRYESNAF